MYVLLQDGYFLKHAVFEDVVTMKNSVIELLVPDFEF